MPLIVPPVLADRLIRLLVLVPELGEAAALSVTVSPLIVLPAPVLLFLKVRLARLLLLIVRDVSETANTSPVVEVEVMEAVPEV